MYELRFPLVLVMLLTCALGPVLVTAQSVEPGAGAQTASADRMFSISLSGRIHVDAYAFDRDRVEVAGGTDLRRARLTVQGRAGSWEYKIDHDFAAARPKDGVRDVYVARKIAAGMLTIGHFKPYRSMEELTSSNEITMMERPFASASGLYRGRQYQYGIGFLSGNDSYTAGVSVFNLRGAAGSANDGVGVAARLSLVPIRSEQGLLHLGASLSHENAASDTPNLSARATYAGRGGPSQSIATTGVGSGKSVESAGLELAGTHGPLYLQSEYLRARFGQASGVAQDVDAWYVMGSWMLTGEHKPYKARTGVFGSPRPAATGGAWELTARYDRIANRSLAEHGVRAAIIGVNWYVNRHVRAMFNYTRGSNDVTGDRTNQYALRAQVIF